MLSAGRSLPQPQMALLLPLHPDQPNGVGEDEQDCYSLDVVKPVTPVILSHFIIIVTDSDCQPLLELQVRDD